MSALALISEFSDLGIRVRQKGENVAVSPKAALTPALISRIKQAKPVLLRELARIRRHAGADWSGIAIDPMQLKAFYELLLISDMRAEGIAPDHYTCTTNCKHCGPVPIWEGCLPEVNGCPWCFNRHQDLPVPKGDLPQ